jgi:hypothetical protein
MIGNTEETEIFKRVPEDGRSQNERVYGERAEFFCPAVPRQFLD